MAYESINPATGKTLKSFDELTDKQVELKLATAASCFDTWKKKSYSERAKIVSKAADLIRANVDKFAKHATLEMGKLSMSHAVKLFSARISFLTTLKTLKSSLPL